MPEDEPYLQIIVDMGDDPFVVYFQDLEVEAEGQFDAYLRHLDRTDVRVDAHARPFEATDEWLLHAQDLGADHWTAWVKLRG
jgi:hypothetical protein